MHSRNTQNSHNINSNTKIQTSSQLNHSAFHTMVPYIISFISPQSIHTGEFQFNEITPSKVQVDKFKKTKGYQNLLKSFVEYYNLDNIQTAEKSLQSLIKQYPHPLDHQVLLGPVLRLTLKRCLLENKTHQQDSKLSSKEAYQNYCHDLGDPTQCAHISSDLIKLLGKSFDFNMMIHSTDEQPISNQSQASADFLANIEVANTDNIHWDILTHKQNHWDWNAYPEQSCFRAYHDISLEALAFNATQAQLELLQGTFRKKIKDHLTNKIDYQEEGYTVISNTNWANNGSLSGLVALLSKHITGEEPLSYVSDQEAIHFHQTPGFKAFLKAFAQHYGIAQDTPEEALLQKIQLLLQTYPHPQAHFVILSPVLRKMLPAKQHNDSPITHSSLAALCQCFQITLEIYNNRDLDKVSCFDKIVEIQSTPYAFTTLSVVNDPHNLKWIHKDPLQSISAAAISNHPYPEHFDSLDFQEKIKLGLNNSKKRSLNPNKNHTYQAMLNAIQNKDLFLIERLCKQGVPLASSSDDSLSSLLALSLKIATQDPKDLSFSLSLQKILLIAFYERQLKIAAISQDTFKLSDKALDVVKQAIEGGQDQWVSQLMTYFESAPRLFENKKIMPSLSYNVEKVLEILSNHAHQAMQANDIAKLKRYLTVDLRCMGYPGKHNLMHLALQSNTYDVLEKTHCEAIIKNLESLKKRSLTTTEKEALQQYAKRCFNSFSEVAYDQFGRTAAFRLARKTYQKKLKQSFLQASSLLSKIKIKIKMILFYLGEIKNGWIDKFHEKSEHIDKIQQKKIYIYGSRIQTAMRFLHTLAYEGPIRYGIQVIWALAPSLLKKNLFQSIGKVCSYAAPYIGLNPQNLEYYIPIFLDNAFTLILMPQYYIASTLFSLGIYRLFKDSGYDNLEALAYMLSEGISFSWATGSDQNMVVDQRYEYHLQKNLTPFVGKWLAESLTPLIAAVDGLSISCNQMINYPIHAIKAYFNNNPFWKDQTFFSLEGSIFKTGLNTLSDIYYQKRFLEEKGFYYLEHSVLKLMRDSAFKRERQYAIQSFNTFYLHQDTASLESVIQSKQASLAYDQAEYEKAKASLALLKEQANDSLDPKVVKQANIVDKAYQKYVNSLKDLEYNQNNLEAHLDKIALSTEKQDAYFKATEGYVYLEDWKNTLLAMKYAEVDPKSSSTEVQQLKEKEKIAYEKSQFYNSNQVNQSNTFWKESVDDLFRKSKDNFLDSNNLVKTIEGIVYNTFSISSDRNEMAKYCADQIIRYKYPLYPGVGDAAEIEAERQGYIDDIAIYKLEGHQRKPSRVQDRLYDYIYSKMTMTPEKKHIHRFDRLYKPIVNEMFGKTIGWIPYKDFKGGRNGKGEISLALNRSGKAHHAYFTVADTPVYTLYRSEKKEKNPFTFSKPDLHQQNGVEVNHASYSNIKQNIESEPFLSSISSAIKSTHTNSMYFNGTDGRGIQSIEKRLEAQLSQAFKNIDDLQKEIEHGVSFTSEKKKSNDKNKITAIAKNKVKEYTNKKIEKVKEKAPIVMPKPEEERKSERSIASRIVKNAMLPIVWISEGISSTAQANPAAVPMALRLMYTAAAGIVGNGLIKDLQNRKNEEWNDNEFESYPIHERDDTKYAGGYYEDNNKGNATSFPISKNQNNQTKTLVDQPKASSNPYIYPETVQSNDLLIYYKRKHRSNSIRLHAPDKDKRYISAPNFLPGFPDAKWAKGKTPYAAGKERKRWKLPDGKILEWDSQHGEIEMYSKIGNHLGVYDPNTGDKLEEAIKNRNIKDYL